MGVVIVTPFQTSATCPGVHPLVKDAMLIREGQGVCGTGSMPATHESWLHTGKLSSAPILSKASGHLHKSSFWALGSGRFSRYGIRLGKVKWLPP